MTKNFYRSCIHIDTHILFIDIIIIVNYISSWSSLKKNLCMSLSTREYATVDHGTCLLNYSRTIMGFPGRGTNSGSLGAYVE